MYLRTYFKIKYFVEIFKYQYFSLWKAQIQIQVHEEKKNFEIQLQMYLTPYLLRTTTLEVSWLSQWLSLLIFIILLFKVAVPNKSTMTVFKDVHLYLYATVPTNSYQMFKISHLPMINDETAFKPSI